LSQSGYGSTIRNGNWTIITVGVVVGWLLVILELKRKYKKRNISESITVLGDTNDVLVS
jgi:hypothetical protein